MAVVERDERNSLSDDMAIDPQSMALMAPLPRRASNRGRAQSDSAALLEVMCDPYEWKSAVKVALALFVASLALAPALTPDHRKLAAEINTKTLRAAAAVKSSTR